MGQNFMSELYRKGFEALIQLASDMSDSQRVELAELHQPWRQKAYKPNEYVKHGHSTTTGRAILYRSTRNVPENAQPPNASANPQYWMILSGQ